MKPSFCWIASPLSLLALSSNINAYNNGLGLTPPMGWNSWNHFGCEIDEDLIQDTAQAMIDLGLDRVGYSYINLDDCWQKSRNHTTGCIQEDFTKFPSGLNALSAYVHSLHLRFGLYSDAGVRTCQGRPGGLGFEIQDASIYAQWKIDYLKYDNCFNVGMNVKTRYQRMHDALNNTGHPIFFSMCEWGVKDPALWASNVGNSWRTTGDISANWKSITTLADRNDQWHDHAGPGGWNDPDMLEVGNGDLSMAEQRSHFTLWCLMKSPLLIGNDLRNLGESQDVLDILSNTELIAWNQDPMGVQGYKRTKTKEGLEVWAGPLADDDVAIVLFNRSNKVANITAFWKDVGIDPDRHIQTMQVRDVWGHTDLGSHSYQFTALVGSHDVVALRLMPKVIMAEDNVGYHVSS